jgi:hypothetical protein
MSASLWPPVLPHLGPKHLGPLACCVDCLEVPWPPETISIVEDSRTGARRTFVVPAPISTWTWYGQTPLCLRCARTRATTRGETSS